MAIKSVQAIVNGVTTTLTYDSKSKTYKATLTAPAKSSYNQSGHYYGVQIIAKDEAGNTTTVNQSDATLGSKLRLTVKEKTAPVITISSPTASQLLTSNQPTISFTVTDDDSGVNPDTIKLLIDGSEISGITKTKTTSGYSCSYKPSTALSDGSHTVVVKASDYDGKELNFQHSIGTVYKASASIDGSEKDHVAVLTATDSAGNSTTETMVISISGSWTTPKTDWYGYTDDDGIYHGDRFNTEDFNRIKNNLAYLREIAVAMYQEFSINDLGDDRSKDQYFYADEINQLEENIKLIAENTFKPDIGENPLYTANGKIFDFNELNRIESLILDLFNQLLNQYRGRQMLTFNFGIRREAF